MTIVAIDESQRKAARIVGFTYLLGMVTANFAESYVAGTLIVADNAVETARNIVAHERLFRLGIASEFITWAADALARLYICGHEAGFNVGLMFFGLGSTVFGYLWLKRGLARAGVGLAFLLSIPLPFS